MNLFSKPTPLLPSALTALFALTAAPAFAATITVDTLVDADVGADGLCSLREAIVAANDDSAYHGCSSGSGDDTITFSVSGTIVLNAGLPAITQNLVLDGPGADQLTVDGAGVHSLLAFTGTLANPALTVARLRLQNGSAFTGGAITTAAGMSLTVEEAQIQDCRAPYGGAVYANENTVVTIVRSTLRRNSGTLGGALYVQAGAVIEIRDSTVSGNSTDLNGAGGAIFTLRDADLTVRRSTFTANSANGFGGAIALQESTANVRASAIVNNEADANADGYGDGGGIWMTGAAALTLKNTIVATNRDGSLTGDTHPDFSFDATTGAAITTRGFNFVGINEGAEDPFPSPTVPAAQNINGDFVGVLSAPLDPMLERLADNGGPTRTRLPQAGSPVIDQGDCTAATADQRGYSDAATGLRVVDDPAIANAADGCDIGPIEVGAAAP